VDNDQIIVYSKIHRRSVEHSWVTVVHLDPYHMQSGWVDSEDGCIHLDTRQQYQMPDRLPTRAMLRGPRNGSARSPARCLHTSSDQKASANRGRGGDYFAEGAVASSFGFVEATIAGALLGSPVNGELNPWHYSGRVLVQYKTAIIFQASTSHILRHQRRRYRHFSRLGEKRPDITSRTRR